jgi:hypothetical protein
VIGQSTGKPERTLEIGSHPAFLVLQCSHCGESFISGGYCRSARRDLPRSVISVLIGKPFAREFVAAGSADVVKTELFGRMIRLLTWMWVGVRRYDGVGRDPPIRTRTPRFSHQTVVRLLQVMPFASAPGGAGVAVPADGCLWDR